MQTSTLSADTWSRTSLVGWACFPLLVQFLAVNNDIRVEVALDVTVRGLKGGKLGGPPVMHAEDLKGWIMKDKR